MPTPSHEARHHVDSPLKTTYLVLFLCFLSIVADGYDIGVMGAIVPSLLQDRQWKLSPLEVGAMSSMALVGTTVGMYFISLISDAIGRKPVLIGSVALFSVAMLGAAWAPTPTLFSILRFIGGLGLGGVVSAAAVLTVEYSPVSRRNMNFALMYAGYAIGALLSAVIAIASLKAFGWRFVVAIGAVPLLWLPAFFIWLPESLEFLLTRGKLTRARTLARRLGIDLPTMPESGSTPVSKRALGAVIAELFSHDKARSTICLWIAQMACTVNIYGLGTWLPQLMRKLGYDLGPSLSFLAVFMLSSALGGILIGSFSDRLGTRKFLVGGYLVGALACLGLTVRGTLVTNYILVGLAGLGSIGVATVQVGFIATYYRPHVRASAVGWASGIGRLGAIAGPMIGAYLVQKNLSVEWNFFVFASAAMIAGTAIALTRSPETASRSLEPARPSMKY
jgi:AAHS family benzoate transporter-like MFS transporter